MLSNSEVHRVRCMACGCCTKLDASGQSELAAGVEKIHVVQAGSLGIVMLGETELMLSVTPTVHAWLSTARLHGGSGVGSYLVSAPIFLPNALAELQYAFRSPARCRAVLSI